MSRRSFSWQVAGAAGEGIKTTGMMFSKTCLRSGLYTFDYTEYPSLIRGGHNTYQVCAGLDRVFSQTKQIDLHIALNKDGVLLHRPDFHSGSIILYDAQDSGVDWDKENITGKGINIPFIELVKKAGAERVMLNNVALGVSAYLLNLDFSVLNTVIADAFKGKSTEIISLNQQAAKVGYDYGQQNLTPLNFSLSKQKISDNLTLSGNEAIALGLVAGGLKAYIAYPMTPSSSILHTLADWQEQANIFVKHAEDEIGVVNMALGMSYAGIRSACGTSGGGFCYMTEAVGLAGVAELPLVVIEAQRPGPALGMPTWTAQADLLFCINASQDEFPRIVLAPGDVREAFDLSRLSLELAEKYQLPVIILTDKHLSESSQSTHLDQLNYSLERYSMEMKPDVNQTGFYPRFTLTETGVSPRTVPGQPNGFYMANSYEHDIQGLGSESSLDRVNQMDKRLKKLLSVKPEIPTQFYSGSKNAQVTLIGWGSTKYALCAASQQLSKEGIEAAVFNLSWLWPFPQDQVENVLKNCVCPIIVEGNSTYQLAKLIRQETGIDIYHKRCKYDGRPIYPEEVVTWVKEII